MKDFLTTRWNNYLTIILAIPSLILSALIIFTDTFSDQAGFWVFAAVGVFY